MLDRARLLLAVLTVYLAVALPYMYLSYGRPLREEPAENLRVDRVRITLEEPGLRFQALLKPYVSRNLTVGIGVVIPAQLEVTDDPREVLRSAEPAFLTNSPPASSCAIGVLFWSSQGPSGIRYSSLNWGRRHGRWIHFSCPERSEHPAGLPVMIYNATIWSGDNFWTVTGIEPRKVLDLSFLRFLLIPAILISNFWALSLPILIGIGIWWRFLKKPDQA